VIETEIKRVYYNQTHELVKFELRSTPCVARTIAARVALVELLQTLVEHQNYLHCDAELLEKASIVHDGNRWIFRSEAKVLKTLES
jgi:hypothetical protein